MSKSILIYSREVCKNGYTLSVQLLWIDKRYTIRIKNHDTGRDLYRAIKTKNYIRYNVAVAESLAAQHLFYSYNMNDTLYEKTGESLINSITDEDMAQLGA